MKKRMKLFVALLLCALLALPLAAGLGGCKDSTQKIGILMPSENEPRWQQDSENLSKQLKAKGYKAEIKNARSDAATQIEQIQKMIDDNFNILVVAPHDGASLTAVLQKAADKGIKIIAYDRLLMNTPNVDYYVTFDNYEVGALQGRYIEKTLDLKNAAVTWSFNIEIFAGAKTDNNAFFFYNGAMDVLQPHIDSGKLFVQSNETEMDDVTTLEWAKDNAKTRMASLLEEYYGDNILHAVLSPNDGLAMGIIEALKDGGYGVGDGKKAMPLITGQDSDKVNVQAIIDGFQAMTVFKDTRELANRTFRIVDALLLGNTPETNDTTTYNNGVKFVPTYMCKPVEVTKANYKAELIDSGYYKITDFTV